MEKGVQYAFNLWDMTKSALPTLTDVLPSSSDALLPPPTLLATLIRLLLLGGLIIALSGRCGKADGDPGGELAMALIMFVVATKCM